VAVNKILGRRKKKNPLDSSGPSSYILIMKHLIIGAGNMGLKHGKILESLGDICVWVDINYKDAQPPVNFSGFDSIMICTPPETHAQLINEFPHHVLFVEKPAILPIDSLPEKRKKPSHVACNWRWCKCIQSYKNPTLRVGYSTTKENAKLDLIHFYDLFVQDGYKRDDSLRIVELDDLGMIWFDIFHEGAIRRAEIQYKQDFKNSFNSTQRRDPWPFTLCQGNRIHKDGPCDMFTEQMRYYRRLVAGEEKEKNLLDQASQRIKELWTT